MSISLSSKRTNEEFELTYISVSHCLNKLTAFQASITFLLILRSLGNVISAALIVASLISNISAQSESPEPTLLKSGLSLAISLAL